MGHRVVRLGHADLRIRAGASLAGELESDDPRHVGLQRQHLQVEHQLDVVLPRLRHAGRPLQRRQGSTPRRAARRAGSGARPRARCPGTRSPSSGRRRPAAPAGAPCRRAPSRGCWRPTAGRPAAAAGCRRRRTNRSNTSPRVGLGRQRRRGRRPRQAVHVDAGRSRCRSCRPARSGPCRAPATESPSRRRPPPPRSGRQWSPTRSRCLPSACRATQLRNDAFDDAWLPVVYALRSSRLVTTVRSSRYGVSARERRRQLRDAAVDRRDPGSPDSSPSE